MLLKLTVILLALACIQPAIARLPEQISELLHAANIPEHAMAAIVLRAADGKPVLEHGAERSFQPASTLKLLTSIVALETLGPTYRGRAELRSDAAQIEGKLTGNVLLRGVAHSELHWEFFQRMLQELRRQGIETIEGDLLLDRHLFQPPRTDLGVAPFDEAPEFRYNVIPDALLLNSNLLRFDFDSDTTHLYVQITPRLEHVKVKTHMSLVDRACSKWEDGWKIPTWQRTDDDAIEIVLFGEFPKNCSISTELNVLDRTDFTDRLFRSLWRQLGGKFHGRTREGIVPAGARVLAEHRSRSLAEIVREINKRSDNPITRTVYLTLGTFYPDQHDSTWLALPTAARAELVVRNWLKRQGIDDQGLVLDNGSGLSRQERIRPTQLAAVLQAALRSPWAPEFMASLPIVGIDGAMSERLRNSPAAKRGRIKTGTLRNAFAIAGYVPDATGQLYIVVAMINHDSTQGSVARPILDALIDSVARYR